MARNHPLFTYKIHIYENIAWIFTMCPCVYVCGGSKKKNVWHSISFHNPIFWIYTIDDCSKTIFLLSIETQKKFSFHFVRLLHICWCLNVHCIALQCLCFLGFFICHSILFYISDSLCKKKKFLRYHSFETFLYIWPMDCMCMCMCVLDPTLVVVI